MKQLLLLFFFTLTGTFSFAQRETDNWFFGDHASLEFNPNGVPVSNSVSAMNTQEGCATISDEFGNLLFYTNGETVWNALHLPMANGNSLTGYKQATQSCIIIPHPGNKSLYYIITQVPTTIGGISGFLTSLNYSIVDITAQNGLGEVIAGSKNIVFYSTPANYFLSEKLTAVYQYNNKDIWLITHRFFNQWDHEFLSFKITAAGIQTAPVTSQFPYQFHHFVNNGALKADPTGNWVAGSFEYGTLLLKFNNKTGIVSNPINISQPSLSTEFSPDGTKLYIAPGSGSVEQYSLSSGVATTIIASKITIFISSIVNYFFQMQLASNGKIYAGKQGANALMEIANPNIAGMGCNFRQGPTLAPLTFCRDGLPNFMQGYFAPPAFNFTGICQGSPITFTIVNQAGLDSVKWNFGEPLSGLKNFSKAWQPNHTYTFAGFYNVTLTTFSNGDSAVYSRNVTLKNSPQVHLGKDTILCKGRNLNLRNAFPASPFNERYRWNTKDTTASIMVTTSGIYWLELSNGFCTARDSIKVTFVDAPKVVLGPSNKYCGGTTVTLDAGNALPGTTYLWRPGGQTTQTISVTQSGQYAVTVTRNGCVSSDFVDVTFNPKISVNLGPDREVCEEDGEIVLNGPGPFTNPPATYLWHDGTTGTSMKINKSGKYWLRVTRGICTESDTVTISYKGCPPPPIPIIPNIITPNNDHVNDYFEIKNIPVGEWKLKTFSRWGVLLFETDNYFNNWPQKQLNDGVYFYLLEDTSTDRKFKGWVEIVH